MARNSMRAEQSRVDRGCLLQVHNFLIDQRESASSAGEPDELSAARGAPTAFLQDELILADEHRRGIRQDLEENAPRMAAARGLQRA